MTRLQLIDYEGGVHIVYDAADVDAERSRLRGLLRQAAHALHVCGATGRIVAAIDAELEEKQE